MCKQRSNKIARCNVIYYESIVFRPTYVISLSLILLLADKIQYSADKCWFVNNKHPFPDLILKIHFSSVCHNLENIAPTPHAKNDPCKKVSVNKHASNWTSWFLYHHQIFAASLTSNPPMHSIFRLRMSVQVSQDNLTCLWGPLDSDSLRRGRPEGSEWQGDCTGLSADVDWPFPLLLDASSSVRGSMPRVVRSPCDVLGLTDGSVPLCLRRSSPSSRGRNSSGSSSVVPDVVGSAPGRWWKSLSSVSLSMITHSLLSKSSSSASGTERMKALLWASWSTDAEASLRPRSPRQPSTDSIWAGWEE